MFRLRLQDSVAINRPIDEVWAYMVDINNAHQWQPYLVVCEQTPPDRVGVGTKQSCVFDYLGRRFENHYVVTAYEPSKRAEFMSLPGSAIPAWGENSVEPVEGGTKLTMFFGPEIGNFFGFVPKWLVAWMYKRTLRSNLDNIKIILETPVAYPSGQGLAPRPVGMIAEFGNEVA